MSFRLRLLGGASIESDGVALVGTIAQRRRVALLALLASAPGGASRERLAALLFPESGAAHAHKSLSDALHAVRKVLGRDAVLAVGDQLRLDPAAVTSDLAELEAALAGGDAGRVLALHRGPFMDGFFLSGAAEFERWMEAERARIAREVGRVLRAAAMTRESADDWSGAVHWWRSLASHEPDSTRIALRLVAALERTGDEAAALGHARLHARMLREVLDVEPPAEVEAAIARLGAAPARAGNGRRHPPADVDAAPSPRVASADSPVTSPSPSHATSPWRRRRRPLAVLLLGGTLAAAGGLAFGWRGDDDAAAATPPIRSIAVLPLENLSGDSSQNYLSIGMTEALITELARLRSDLRIISRASVARYRDRREPAPAVARALGVDAVVEGAVIREGERVRVSVQLVHAPTDRHLWAERYDREYGKLLGVQADIAGAIAREIGHRASPPPAGLRRSSPAATDPAVHEAYMRGREALMRNSSLGAQLAAQHFQRAIAGDSTYAPAWAGLADAYVLSALVPDIPQRVLYAQARVAARRAVALDDELAEAHVALGNVLKHEGDRVGAEAEIQRAVALNPNHARARQKLGELLVERGEFAEAERHLDVARSLDPLSPIVQSIYGWALASQGKYDRAIAVYQHVLQQDSTHVLAHSLLGASLIFAGRYDEALAAMRRFERTTGVRRSQHIGVAYARSGRREEAWREYRDLEQRLGVKGSFALAVIAANLGDHERALRHLERERRNGRRLAGLQYDPWLAPLRGKPGFEAFVRRVEAP